jgi:hypothetical protein
VALVLMVMLVLAMMEVVLALFERILLLWLEITDFTFFTQLIAHFDGIPIENFVEGR